MRSFRYDRRPFPPFLLHIDFNAAQSRSRVPSFSSASSSALSVKSFQNGLRHRVRKEEEEVGNGSTRNSAEKVVVRLYFCFVTELCGGTTIDAQCVSHHRRESTIKSCYSESTTRFLANGSTSPFPEETDFFFSGNEDLSDLFMAAAAGGPSGSRGSSRWTTPPLPPASSEAMFARKSSCRRKRVVNHVARGNVMMGG